MQLSIKHEQPAMQRARGAIDLAFAAGKLERFYQSGSAKIFMPKTYAATTEAVLVNTAGGLADGDDFNIKISTDNGTHLTVSTQTAERVYRALGAQTANMRIDMELTGNASLHWLPQETILFDDARFSRQLNVEMDDEASFLASEMIVLGRTAMQETVRKGSLRDQWRIRRGDRLIHAEALRLDGDIGQKMKHMASAANSICLSTIIYISPNAEDRAGAARTFFKDYPATKTAVTAWDGKLVIRSLGDDTAQLKKTLAQFIEQFRKIANPRVWNY